MSDSPEATTIPSAPASLRPGVTRPAVLAVLAAALGISTGYGMLLLLPLFVQDLGGSEAAFGLILAAAVIPAVTGLVWVSAHPEKYRPHWLLLAAICGFGAAAAGTSLVGSTWQPLIPVGLVLGTGWAVVYTVMPMIVDGMVTEAGRVTHFGYLTGTQQLGIGAGPVLAGWLADTRLGLRGTFLVAALVCAAAAVATVIAAVLTPDPRTASPDRAERPGTGGLRHGTGEIVRSPVGPWLLVITLFACLFTTMTQFQTTYAHAQGLDYSIFYVAYTVAVIAVRFVVSPWVTRFDQATVAACAITVMVAAVASFLAVGSSAFAYATAASLLGLGYGLALPTSQAQAVSVSTEAARPRVLPLAGLVFQTAILAFPLVVGWIVVRSGYWLLLAVLITFAAVQAWVAWRQATIDRRKSARVT